MFMLVLAMKQSKYVTIVQVRTDYKINNLICSCLNVGKNNLLQDLQSNYTIMFQVLICFCTVLQRKRAKLLILETFSCSV